MNLVGDAAKLAEGILGGVWSVGEVAVLLSRFDEVRRDPFRNALFEDIHERGWYPAVSNADFHLTEKNKGWIVGVNPYRRIGLSQETRRDDQVVAKLVRAEDAAKHLVIVCHCYGVPVPPIMERLFGLHRVPGIDVAYNIMNHHQRGTFDFWPGTGFASGRVSHFLENLRSSITGVRALASALKEVHGYEKITVIGFSIGGQLAMHLANSAPIDQAILYCPVTSLHQTAKTLGLMGALIGPVSSLMKNQAGKFELDELQIADPLRYDLRIDPANLHVIAQRYDALTPLAQVSTIREKYPQSGWYEYNGTHVYPAGKAEFQRVIRRLL